MSRIKWAERKIYRDSIEECGEPHAVSSFVAAIIGFVDQPAEQTDRKASLMKLDLPCCDVIAHRFQRFTGEPAILERMGESPLPMKPRELNMR